VRCKCHVILDERADCGRTHPSLNLGQMVVRLQPHLEARRPAKCLEQANGCFRQKADKVVLSDDIPSWQLTGPRSGACAS
jgi:hypothetical protein